MASKRSGPVEWWSGHRWNSLHDELVKAYEDSAMPPNQMCVKCCEHTVTINLQHDAEVAVMRCLDCGPHQYLCRGCAESLHRERNYFHIAEIWMEKCKMFVPVLLGGHTLCDPHHLGCPSVETRIITCVDQQGRQHLKNIRFCQCISDAATLIKLHLWPGSPSKPKIAFHFNLMDMAETFLLESHVSLHKFCSSIQIEYPAMLPKLIKNIYAILNCGSFDS